MGGTSDAYVLARLPTGVKGVQRREDQVFRTKVVFVTVAPVWNHNMFFRVFPSTKRQLKAAAGNTGGVLGAIVNGAYFGAEKIGKITGCAAPPVDPLSPAGKLLKKKPTLMQRAMRAVRGTGGFKTDVANRKQKKDIEKQMVTRLGGGSVGGPGGRRAGKPSNKAGGVDVLHSLECS